ncbi:MAG: SGNH/GDSL hydrolase family protein [Nocardioidaceae bacterium]|nr:SGNH/GDSL hydrolase family protein [Nocardioidaceae bacterium]
MAILVTALALILLAVVSRRFVGNQPESSISSLAVLGDSYSAGSRMGGHGGNGWPALVARHFGATLDLEAVPGRGYRNPGRVHPGHTFPQQARALVGKWHGDVLIVFGSRNDSHAAPSRLRDTAEATLRYLRFQLPDTHIVVIGPMWPVLLPPGGDPEGDRAAIREAAEAVRGLTYVDPMNPPWFSAKNIDLIGEDRIHPTDEGHRYLSRRIIDLLVSDGIGA